MSSLCPPHYQMTIWRVYLWARRLLLWPVTRLGLLPTLRLQAGANVLAEVATIIGILGGAAVMSLFKSDVLLGLYASGLLVGLLLFGKQETQSWRSVLVPPAAPVPSPSAPVPDGENVG